MKKLFLLCLMCSFSSLMAQSKLKTADKLFKTYHFLDAAKAYDEYLEKEKSPATQTLKNAGDSYYFVDDLRNALRWYQKLYDVQGTTINDMHFLRYTESLKGVGDYDKSDIVTKEFLAKKGDPQLISRYNNQKRQRDSMAAIKSLYTVKNLDINSSKSDFGTAFYGDKIVYSSSKDTTEFKNKLYSWNKQPFLKLYIAERNAVNGDLFNDTPFLPNVDDKYHQAAMAFSPDWKTVYYSNNIVRKRKLVNDPQGTNNFQITRGIIENGKLAKPEKLFFNSKDYSVGHPALSQDGKWLFFASDMPGGFGESDLYVSTVAADGTIGTPKNLGPTINTVGNDMFPSFTNGILYFSSDGHYGWGGLDIYESKFYGDMKF